MWEGNAESQKGLQARAVVKELAETDGKNEVAEERVIDAGEQQ